MYFDNYNPYVFAVNNASQLNSSSKILLWVGEDEYGQIKSYNTNFHNHLETNTPKVWHTFYDYDAKAEMAGVGHKLSDYYDASGDEIVAFHTDIFENTLPELTNLTPAASADGVEPDTNIYINVTDNTQVMDNIYVKVGGEVALQATEFKPGFTGNLTPNGNGYDIEIDPDVDFDFDSRIWIYVWAADDQGESIDYCYFFDTKPGLSELTIETTSGQDGFVVEDFGGVNTGGATLYTGDAPDNKELRSFVGFDLSAVPAGAIVDNAKLWVYVSGSVGEISSLTLEHISFGETLDATDFGIALLTNHEATYTQQELLIGGWVEKDVTNQVSDDVANTRAYSQYRFFAPNIDADGSADNIRISSADSGSNPAALIITYSE